MKDWVQLQLQLYQNLKEEALSFLKKRPKAFLRYEREFLNDQKDFQESNHRELTKALNESHLALIGDFHTLRQCQRLLLRLLRDSSIKKPDAIGLEILSAGHLPLLESWLHSRSARAEGRLKDALKLEDRWGSNFETYKELFLRCHEQHISLLPLFKADKALTARDDKVARILAATKGRVWALFGEYHCARPHLPKKIKALAPEKHLVVIQQNDDRATLNWMKALALKKTMVLKSAPAKRDPAQLFCVLHTPLWIKYQSYLEKHLQDSESDEFETLDAHEQITWSLRTLIQFLDDPRYPSRKSEAQLLDFNIFDPEESNFYKSISYLPAAEKAQILSQIKSSGLAVLAEKRLIYLSELTINSCAQAAGLYLYLNWSGSRFERDEFFKQTFAEAMAFMMSKLLNHSRRAVSWKRWSDLSKTIARKSEARSVLQGQVFVEKFTSRQAWLKKLKPFANQTAVALGRNLGEAAFEAFLAGEFSRPRLIRLMKTKVRDEKEAFENLVELKAIGRAFAGGDRRW